MMMTNITRSRLYMKKNLDFELFLKLYHSGLNGQFSNFLVPRPLYTLKIYWQTPRAFVYVRYIYWYLPY